MSPIEGYDEITIDTFVAQPSRVSRFISDYLACPTVDEHAVIYEIDDTPYVPPSKWQIRRAVARQKFQQLRRRVFPFYLVRARAEDADEDAW
jgi:hypothetical protein